MGDVSRERQVVSAGGFCALCAVRWRQFSGVIEADFRKLMHDPYELLTRMIQPTIWLLFFGQAMARVGSVPTEVGSYLDYIAPGILAQSVLFVAIFFGLALIWEKDMGILSKILVSPAPRWLLVFARSLCGGLRAFSQMLVIYPLSAFLGIHLRWEAGALLGISGMVVLGGAIFSTLSLIAASIVKKRERFMGIGQAITMPLFFASNALYPIHYMPMWLQVISKINPLTYQVDAIRVFMIEGEYSRFGLDFDFLVGLATLSLLNIIATAMYPKILQ